MLNFLKMNKKKLFSAPMLIGAFTGCSSLPDFTHTVPKVDLMKFMGKWYVIAARPTFLEANAFNSVEIYTWNEAEKRIDIDFSFNKNSLDGPLKKIPQKAWVFNKETNAHWLVSPFWPLKFDYLVIALDPNEQWTAIGVPNQKYLWIMARTPKMSPILLKTITDQISKLGYSTENLTEMKHNN